MSIVADETFRMHHDVYGGPYAGYAVTFALTFVEGRETVIDVWATRKDANPVSDPKIVAKILPFDMWPEFAQNAFRQRVEKGTNTAQERLF